MDRSALLALAARAEDDPEEYDDYPWDDDDEDDWDMDECGMRPDGQCSMAGSEWCDWSCPRGRANRAQRVKLRAMAAAKEAGDGE